MNNEPLTLIGALVLAITSLTGALVVTVQWLRNDAKSAAEGERAMAAQLIDKFDASLARRDEAQAAVTAELKELSNAVSRLTGVKAARQQ